VSKGHEKVTTLWEVEADFICMLAEMQHIGIKIDREFCLPKIEQGEKILNEIRRDLGWNPGSTKQLGKFLLEDMKFPVIALTDNGQPSFSKKAMEEYDEMLKYHGSDVAEKVLRYRGWQKTITSNYKAYIKFADKHDILHPQYKIHGTVTCRISCEKPNLQQIPRRSENEWNGDLKKAFIPREGNVLVEFDFSQLEARFSAAVAGEKTLLDAFNSDNVDVFQVMADRLGWTRHDCKTLTYMTLYGAGPKKVAMVFSIPIQDAKDRINEYFAAYPGLRLASYRATDIAKRNGYIEYWTGRRRHLSKKDAHKAFNAYVQGGAFEIVKRSGLRLRRSIKWPIVLTVHDSYVVELPVEDYTEENCEYIKSILEDVPETPEFGVKFKVSYKQWGS
jgi:DNA polymerase-1